MNVGAIVKRFGAMSEDERRAFTESQIAESSRQHDDFKKAFDRGFCYLCNASLGMFDEREPCLHWLLRPDGVKKKHFPLIADRYGMMQFQSWMRWVANEGVYMQNIRDSSDPKERVVALTARYGDYEWSISCDHNDLAGHKGKGGLASVKPHFHLQMRINGRPFINYNDFHLPIHSGEERAIQVMRASDGLISSKFVFGESFEEILEAAGAEQIVNMPVGDGDPDAAPFRINTILMAREGESISGDELYELAQRAKREKRTVASLVGELSGTNAEIYVGPGPGVADPAPREGGRGSKRDR